MKVICVISEKGFIPDIKIDDNGMVNCTIYCDYHTAFHYSFEEVCDCIWASIGTMYIQKYPDITPGISEIMRRYPYDEISKISGIQIDPEYNQIFAKGIWTERRTKYIQNIDMERVRYKIHPRFVAEYDDETGIMTPTHFMGCFIRQEDVSENVRFTDNLALSAELDPMLRKLGIHEEDIMSYDNQMGSIAFIYHGAIVNAVVHDAVEYDRTTNKQANT